MAYDEFDQEVRNIKQNLLKSGVSKEKVDSLRIENPYDLEFAQEMLNLLADSWNTGIDELPARTPSNPPKHSQVTTPLKGRKKWEYNSAKEAVDDLYDKIGQGGPEAKEAQEMIDKLWKKFATTLKKHQKIGFSVTSCPECGTGLLENEFDICPNCGADIQSYRRKGLNI